MWLTYEPCCWMPCTRLLSPPPARPTATLPPRERERGEACYLPWTPTADLPRLQPPKCEVRGLRGKPTMAVSHLPPAGVCNAWNFPRTARNSEVPEQAAGWARLCIPRRGFQRIFDRFGHCLGNQNVIPAPQHGRTNILGRRPAHRFQGVAGEPPPSFPPSLAAVTEGQRRGVS